ncbi:hypothetical protein QJS66_22795 [Kocuria rhizophila]|nr:hypothetical protein QJS66_22795 [Kocuria rhizophila]
MRGSAHADRRPRRHGRRPGAGGQRSRATARRAHCTTARREGCGRARPPAADGRTGRPAPPHWCNARHGTLPCIVWSGTRATHTATVTAAPASDGAQLAAELARVVGAGTTPRSRAGTWHGRRSEPPRWWTARRSADSLTDSPASTATGLVENVVARLAARSPPPPTRPPRRRPRPDATTVEVVEGTGAGTRFS